jgi:two-component system chemotaxis response regulator CheY
MVFQVRRNGMRPDKMKGDGMWRVLIVDDNFVNRSFSWQYCAITLNATRVEGTEAVEAYTISLNEGEPYDIILLDIAMPEVDGIQVLDTVRSMESKRGVLVGEGIPVIMVTAFRNIL